MRRLAKIIFRSALVALALACALVSWLTVRSRSYGEHFLIAVGSAGTSVRTSGGVIALTSVVHHGQQYPLSMRHRTNPRPKRLRHAATAGIPPVAERGDFCLVIWRGEQFYVFGVQGPGWVAAAAFGVLPLSFAARAATSTLLRQRRRARGLCPR